MYLRQFVDHRGRVLWQADVRSEAGKSLLGAFYAWKEERRLIGKEGFLWLRPDL